MCSLEQFKIDLKNQKDEVRTLDFDLDNLFFAALDGSEVKQGALHVSVSIRKTIGFYELLFHTEGTVTVTCDRCLDDMSQPIEADNRLVVKLGAAYSIGDLSAGRTPHRCFGQLRVLPELDSSQGCTCQVHAHA